ncbi:MAG: DNA repair protein RadA [Pseudomonadota bacterium]|jgi:DNA repair protein RadA/Sms|nr:DNA repair protein RadA [Alphaproteobacteria bacterium]
MAFRADHLPMAKAAIRFICQSCGTSHNRWNGKCEGCGEWNTLVEEVVEKNRALVASANAPLPSLYSVDDESLVDLTKSRYVTSFGEFNRVCGGGIVPGSVILVGGDPGIGKSTLLLQVICDLSNHTSCLYLSGEESVQQLQMRAKRVGVKAEHLHIGSCTNLEEIQNLLAKNKETKLLVVDSIQTVSSDALEAAAGSVSQVRACSQSLIHLAKKKGISVILVGHVTKEGTIAGPRVLEHMVDTVLYFEGERHYDFRILRAVKNRFGATNEIGLFAMEQQGLAEVTNPSALFLSDRPQGISGTAVFAGIEGTRPVLCEIQALVSKSYLGMPRRTTVGWDSARLSMILAVLESRAGFSFGNLDVYLNVVGGLKVNEPAADLAVAAALISALINKPIDPSYVFFGEIGLGGEVRPVHQTEARLKEAEKLGFVKALCASKKNLESALPIARLELLKDLSKQLG